MTIRFLASSDDGTLAKVTGYEIRYRVLEDITEASFDEPGSIDPHLPIAIAEPGSVQTFTLARLLPATEYSVGIRAPRCTTAYDDCRNTSPLTVLSF